MRLSGMKLIFKILAISLVVAAAGFYVLTNSHTSCCTEQLSNAEISALTANAEKGDVASMKRLFLYFEDRQENGDEAKASYWTERAAKAGDAQAEFFMYDRLIGSDNSDMRQQAINYLKDAANRGDAEAQERLGELFLNGSGVPKSQDEAEHWFHLSAEAANVPAILTSCDLVLLKNKSDQLRECLKLNEIGTSQVKKMSNKAKLLAQQHDRLVTALQSATPSMSK